MNQPLPSCQRCSQPTPCRCTLISFFTTVGSVLRRVFQTSAMVSSTLFALFLLHLLAPTGLVHHALFLAVAGGLGLHLPTLLAGQLLHAVLRGLFFVEPLLLVGLLVWAGHKRLVRRAPLFNEAAWRHRFNVFRQDVVNHCNSNRYQHQ